MPRGIAIQAGSALRQVQGEARRRWTRAGLGSLPRGGLSALIPGECLKPETAWRRQVNSNRRYPFLNYQRQHRVTICDGQTNCSDRAETPMRSALLWRRSKQAFRRARHRVRVGRTGLPPCRRCHEAPHRQAIETTKWLSLLKARSALTINQIKPLQLPTRKNDRFSCGLRDRKFQPFLGEPRKFFTMIHCEA